MTNQKDQPPKENLLVDKEDKISLRIKSARNTKGYNQTEMAQLLNMDRSNYHRLENRGKKLPAELLEQIATVLEVPVASFFSDQTEESIKYQELNNLKERIKELEDRLRDKQFRIDRYELDKKEIFNAVHIIIEKIASDLGLIYYPDFNESDEALELWFDKHHSPWFESRLNEKGEYVMFLGDQQLTASDIRAVFSHLKKIDESYGELIQEIFRYILNDGLPLTVINDDFTKELKGQRRKKGSKVKKRNMRNE